ncbi:metal-dependent hydrolase family protein [Actinocatenispora comari]|uniref:Peptidase M38 n=1 Tax=Actinocatenispora comari TaxID=2807577 RepID=A0A8J4AAU3_9ACTN|nr:amidohydrolase family protein [Actinocatenispora comari]GIL28181.1 peptidase M38 [Actinocatenispora comari]
MIVGDRVIRRVSVVEPDTERVRERQRIVIERGVITEVADDPGDAVRDGELDGADRYAVPGLIDCHVHVTAYTADEHALTLQSPSYVAARAVDELAATLARGFTTVRDAAGADHGLAQAIEEGHVVGPRLFFGGKALSATGGHADLRTAGQNVHDTHYAMPGLGRVCDGVTEVRRAARDEIRRGAHHLKLMLSGGCASLTDRIDSLQYSDAEITAAVEEAAAAGIYCAAHAYTAAAVNRALRLGVRTVEHGNLLDETSIAAFQETGAFYVPTLVTYAALAEEGRAHGLAPDSHAKVFDVLDGGLQALRLADQDGLPIAFGTDLLGDMRRRQNEEFALRAEVQTPGAVLRSATTTAAELLNQRGRLGVIAPGAHGDLLLTQHDPLADIRPLASPADEITAVIQAGQVRRA